MKQVLIVILALVGIGQALAELKRVQLLASSNFTRTQGGIRPAKTLLAAFGLWELDLKNKTSSGIEFNTAGHSNQESGKVLGSLETKYKVKDYGLTLTEKWNTDNTLFTEVAVQDQQLGGLKLSLEGNFALQSGNKNGKFKVNIDSDVNIDLKGPLITASAVLGYYGWLAGYQSAFENLHILTIRLSPKPAAEEEALPTK